MPADRTPPLLHVLRADAGEPEWPIGPGSEGFVHLCRPEQAAGVIARFFEGGPATVLVLEDALLEGEVRDEDAYGHGAHPHLYGHIPERAVLGRLDLSAQDRIVERLAELRKQA